tara:strand:- start:427 stop:927 length:501 start_codon:yes stop_codon:yes gene_type:complete
MSTLELKCTIEGLSEKYQSRINHSSDSGVDLYVTEDIIFKPGETVIVDLKVKSRMVDSDGNTLPYYLYPRSSISKTPLMMANSVGIIDKDYRGNIKVALKHVPTNELLTKLAKGYGTNLEDSNYTLKKDTRIAQICGHDLKPINLKLVETLDNTERGEGGFGSTGQ